MAIGARVRGLRARLDLSQGDLVARVRRFAPDGKRFARETLSRIENDRTQPDTWIVDALAQALDTSTDYLLGLSDDPSIPGVAGYPVPELDIAELVDRLNRLPEELRREVAGMIGGAVDLAERLARGLRPQLVIREGQVRYDAGERAARREQLVRLVDSLDEDQERAFYEFLEQRFGAGRDAAGQ